MVGKRAKILSADNVEDLLVSARQTRYPIGNQVLVLLSVKAACGRVKSPTRPGRWSSNRPVNWRVA
jgi:hypothetical protein